MDGRTVQGFVDGFARAPQKIGRVGWGQRGVIHQGAAMMCNQVDHSLVIVLLEEEVDY